MARLIYSTIASLDGFFEDAKGLFFEWAQPDEEVLSFLNDRERTVGTFLYGRRMYETMVYWETASLDESVPPSLRDWAQIWKSAEKVVYSRTLQSISSAKTRIERSFDPEAVRRLKETTDRDLSVGGPELAGQAMKAGLVDEIRLYVAPAVVGGGKHWLPVDNRFMLELLGTHQFSSGFVFLRYRPAHVERRSSFTRFRVTA